MTHELSSTKGPDHSASPEPERVLREYVPELLTSFNQWVCWRYEEEPSREKPMKVPYSPITHRRARVQTASTWGSVDDAFLAYNGEYGYNGVGFVLTQEDDIVGVDIDSCVREDGTITDDAQAIVGLLDSYTEWSPSGHGLRIFVQADLKEFAGRRSVGLELYNFGRYLTVTGHRLEGMPVGIENRLEELRELYRFFFATTRSHASSPLPESKAALQKDETLVLERLFSGSMGNLYSEIYHGVTSGVYSNGEDGKPDESRADVLLFNALAYHTGYDAEAMRRILLASPRALQRMDKWMRRVKGGMNYLEYQIQDSIRYTRNRR